MTSLTQIRPTPTSISGKNVRGQKSKERHLQLVTSNQQLVNVAFQCFTSGTTVQTVRRTDLLLTSNLCGTESVPDCRRSQTCRLPNDSRQSHPVNAGTGRVHRTKLRRAFRRRQVHQAENKADEKEEHQPTSRTPAVLCTTCEQERKATRL